MGYQATARAHPGVDYNFFFFKGTTTTRKQKQTKKTHSETKQWSLLSFCFRTQGGWFCTSVILLHNAKLFPVCSFSFLVLNLSLCIFLPFPLVQLFLFSNYCICLNLEGACIAGCLLSSHALAPHPYFPSLLCLALLCVFR